MRASFSVLVLLCAWLAACSGESGNDSNRNLNAGRNDAGELDGGEDAPDAEPDSDRGELDAGPPEQDAANDTGALGEDAAVGAFSITVRRGQQPVPGARIWFHDGAGTLSGEHFTGDDGRVTSSTTPSMVTAIVVENAGEPSALAQPFTFTALVPGDHLILELPAAQVEATLLPGYLVTVPSEAPGSYVQLLAGQYECAATQGGASPVALDWYSDCPIGENNSILAVAYNSSYGAAGYAFAKQLPAFGASPLAAQLGAWSQPRYVQANVTNLPVESSLELALGVWSDGVRFYPDSERSQYLSSGSATRSLGFPTPDGFAEELELLLTLNDSLPNQHHNLVVRQAYADSIGLDFATRTAGAISGSHGGSGTRPSYTWQTETATATPADASVFMLAWFASTPAGQVRRYWYVLGPGDGNSVTLPEIGAGMFESLGLSVPAVSVSHFAGSLDDGYRAFLRHPIRPLRVDTDGGGVHPLSVELPAVGSLHAVTWLDLPLSDQI